MTIQRLRVVTALLFLVPLLSGASMVEKRVVVDPEAEVLAEIERYYQDFSDRDWEAFADHFWEGATMATIWPPPGKTAPEVWVSSVPEFVAKAPEGPGSKPIFEEHMTSAEVQVEGDLAQVWAHYEAKFGEEGNVMEWSGIDAFTLLKFDGRWRIISLAYVST